MKEIYKIPKGQNISTEKGVKYINQEIRCFVYKTEQVPENWEDLKELCQDLEGKNVFIINAGNCIEFNGLYFWKDGSITTTQNNNDIWATKTNLTPERQYQIIKSLIGEE